MYEYEQEREILIVVDHGVYSGASSTVAPTGLIDGTARSGGGLRSAEVDGDDGGQRRQPTRRGYL